MAVGRPVRLAQVLGNLLNNAAKYTPMGGEITLTAEQHGDRLHLSVRDNGIGIAAETLPHVFDLFMQADPSLDRSQGGLGLGLSLAQTLAHMHDGQITAESGGAGNGSVFTLDLPLGAPGPGASADAAAMAGQSPSRRVLIVEDNADAAEGMALLLGERGHVVNVALDGVSGLDAARRLQPDVIILDIGLPLLDGYQLARELRASPATSRAVLVALSGYGQAADKLKSRSAGIDFHLVKPIDLASLEAVIDTLPEQAE
ncbi:ATP-binding protein [Pigmentiphaga litoralis]|uniref:ATP-binding protein n=1 Tax=Pigmentiphaga litoralis TaxID=516702 RepID=UPI003B4315E5